MKEGEIYSILKESYPDADIDVLRYAAYHLFTLSKRAGKLKNRDEVLNVGCFRFIQSLKRFKESALKGAELITPGH